MVILFWAGPSSSISSKGDGSNPVNPDLRFYAIVNEFDRLFSIFPELPLKRVLQTLHTENLCWLLTPSGNTSFRKFSFTGTSLETHTVASFLKSAMPNRSILLKISTMLAVAYLCRVK
jgi:hypothetical protein